MTCLYVAHVRISSTFDSADAIEKIEGVERVEFCKYHYHISIGKLYSNNKNLRENLFAKVYAILKKSHPEVLIEENEDAGEEFEDRGDGEESKVE